MMSVIGSLFLQFPRPCNQWNPYIRVLFAPSSPVAAPNDSSPSKIRVAARRPLQKHPRLGRPTTIFVAGRCVRGGACKDTKGRLAGVERLHEALDADAPAWVVSLVDTYVTPRGRQLPCHSGLGGLWRWHEESCSTCWPLADDPAPLPRPGPHGRHAHSSPSPTHLARCRATRPPPPSTSPSARVSPRRHRPLLLLWVQDGDCKELAQTAASASSSPSWPQSSSLCDKKLTSARPDFCKELAQTSAPYFSLSDKRTDLFIALGSMYAVVLFIVTQNGQTVQPIVDVERTVFDALRFHVLR
jgi:hypothetical protein